MAIIAPIDLDQLHETIVARLQAAFPNVPSDNIVFDYQRLDRKLPTPAILLELVQFEPTDARGTEQLQGDCRFEARCVINELLPNHGLEVRKLAFALAGYINMTRWGERVPNEDDPRAEQHTLSVGAAEIIGCYPDGFDPALDSYDVWRVEWVQEICINQSAWVPSGEIPSDVTILENVANAYRPSENAGEPVGLLLGLTQS